MSDYKDKIKDFKAETDKLLAQQELFYFEPKNKNSSIGVMPLSQLQTAPIYGFGTAERDKIQKQFLNEQMAKTYLLGKESIGPNYTVTADFLYAREPTHLIGTALRRDKLTEPKYDHYHRIDSQSDPISANILRKPRAQTAKIGLEQRFQNGSRKLRQTPGPQYNPKLKPEVQNSEKYSFGYRREYPGFSCLQPLISTPNVVGPGAYIIQKKPDTSEIITKPKYSFTKEKRNGLQNPNFTLNQTYACVDSVGRQHSSKKRSEPVINIGKAKREAKIGHFKQNMAQQQTVVRIPMPKY